MTNLTPEPPKKSSNVLLFIIIAVAVLLAGSALAFFLSTAGSQNLNEPETPGTAGETNSQTAPKILTVESSLDGTAINFNVEVEQYDSTQWFLEYELADQNRKVVETEYARESQFTISTATTDSSSYRLKVRLSDREQDVSDWSESFTIQIEDLEGANVLEPNEAYYNSAWAKGEGTQEALSTALEVAYNAEPAPADAANFCLPLNNGTVKPTLLLPPIPAVKPTDVILSYDIKTWNDSTQEALLTYYWC